MQEAAVQATRCVQVAETSIRTEAARPPGRTRSKPAVFDEALHLGRGRGIVGREEEDCVAAAFDWGSSTAWLRGSFWSRPADGRAAETSATGSAAPETSHCRPPSPITDASSGLEISATSEGDTVWALVEGPAVTRTRPPTIVAGRPVKLIWRATGCGDLAVVAFDEAGLTLTSAQQAHTGSTWIRPGDEWGSGFTFPHGGCWELLATRGGTRRRVWLVVASA